ncbi:hypothetical protein HDV02_006664 [Globomyces sp. JEL0801]|nr:hypothetical protein HDV02_006664 [Globomyces sp. JEL0801]
MENEIIMLRREQTSVMTDLENIEVETPEDLYPDGGYGWLMVFLSFIIHIVTIGIPALIQGSHSPMDVAFIGSCGTGGMGFFALASGLIIDQFGHQFLCVIGGILIIISYVLASYSTEYWQLLLTQGILFGMGCAISYFPGMTIISHWFNKRKGVAIGIAVSGSVAPILQYLISSVGVTAAIRITGITGGVIVIICGLLLKPRLPPSKKGDFDYKAILFDSKFIRLFFMVTFAMFGYFIPFFFIPSFAVQNGLSTTDGALLLGYMQGASAVGRIALGFNADILGHINTLTICPVIGAMTVLLLWPFSKTYGMLTLFSVLYGFFVGGLLSLLPSAIIELFGTKNVASITGMVYTAFLFGDTLGPPFAGFLLGEHEDKSGIKIYDFTTTIMLTGGCILVGAILMVSIKISVAKGRFFARV